MPKSKLVQEQQNHYNEREKGDVLLSEEQPSFVVCASSTNMMQTLNDKCVKNALTCSESRDQDDNNSSVTGKADSSEFSVQYPSNNLKHDLVCDDIPLMIFEKGKVQNHTINFHSILLYELGLFCYHSIDIILYVYFRGVEIQRRST